MISLFITLYYKSFPMAATASLHLLSRLRFIANPQPLPPPHSLPFHFSLSPKTKVPNYRFFFDKTLIPSCLFCQHSFFFFTQKPSRFRLFSMAAEPKESPANNPGLHTTPDEATKGYFMQQTVSLFFHSYFANPLITVTVCMILNF